jgi:ATP-binding cassette subfamily B protein
LKDIYKILKLGSHFRSSYIAVSILTVLLSLITIFQPLLTGWAIDEIQKGSEASIRYAFMLAGIMFLLDLCQNLFSNWAGYIGDQLSVKLNKLLSEKYYEHLLNLPQRFFDDEQSGKLISRLNRSIVQITNFVQMMTNNFLQFIFSTILSLVIVFYISWEVGIMLAVLYPLFVWMTVRTSSTWQEYQTKKNKHFDYANGRFAESITQVKVVKSYGQQTRELSFFSKHFSSVLKLTKPQSAYWHKQDIKRRLLLNMIFFGVFGFIFVRGAQGVFSAGEAVTLILYAINIRIPIFTISYIVESTQRAISDSKDYFEVLAEEPELDSAVDTLSVAHGDIVFDGVTFGYDAKKTILNDVSFSAKSGEKIALVGESGEGKTTLTNILLRLYDPQKGGISIDGQDIQTVSKRSLRESIAVVFQDPNLFSGTIRENIAYADPKATDEAVREAARAANAHEFIEQLEKGYDTEIGEKGLKLSGGQKQRIAIARALYKDAPILILDEATSSLDSRSELLVQEALERLMKDRTTIIIAHRLSTIQSVDTIVALKNGKVAEMGSPRSLARAGGIYARLLQLQTARSAEERQEALAKFGIVA